MKEKNKPKILVIVGQTASGKTSLSIPLAQRYNGEIVSADSRQVYKGLDIGTGKVTREEMCGIPHHLLDIADPRDTYTVADFVRDGRASITDILSRGKLPIVVGGTFFYVDALLGRSSTPSVPPNPKLRATLESKDMETLFALLREKDRARAAIIDKDNKRRLVRALEIVDALGTVPPIKTESPYNPLILGITISKEQVQENIHARLTARMDHGMIDEVISLNKNGLPFERLAGLGIEYAAISEFLQNHISREDMLAHIETKSWQYAKRQMTWLRRDKTIHWIDPQNVNAIYKIIDAFLM